MKIGLLYSDALKEYDFGPGHPFRGDRFERFISHFKETIYENGKIDLLTKNKLASNKDLLLWHNKDYIKAMQNASIGNPVKNYSKFVSGDNLNPLTKRFPRNIEIAARVIVKNSMTACELVQEKKYEKVISLGGGLHHAKPRYGEGFCIYNDVVIAVKHIIKKYDLERILIIDTDAHAGNGTSEAFYQDPNILLIDMHQKYIYPRTGFEKDVGEGEGKGFTVNIPLPPFADDNSYRLAFEEIVYPIAYEFIPQFIIRYGGSDPLRDDRITQLGLTLKGLHYIGQKVRQIAEICDGKEVDLICSGYEPKILPEAWLAIVEGLAGFEIKDKELSSPMILKTRTLEKTKNIIKEVKKNLHPYWKALKA